MSLRNLKTHSRLRAVLVLMLCLALLPLPAALAGPPVRCLYTVTAGEALAGDETEMLRDLLDTMRLELTSYRDGDLLLGRAVLISGGQSALSLRVRDSEKDGIYALSCSLLGANSFVCRKGQFTDVLVSVVEYLANAGFLDRENMDVMRRGAASLGNMLQYITDIAETSGPDEGMNLYPYLGYLAERASSSEETELDGTDPECPGAAVRTVWHLNETDMLRLADIALEHALSVPVVGEYLQKGQLRIGLQRISVSFLRSLVSSMEGETVLSVYRGEDGKIMKMVFRIPDISELVADPDFARITGLVVTVDRSREDALTGSSLSTLTLTGLDQVLLTILLEKSPGESIPDPLQEGTRYDVGDMSSAEIGELIDSLWLEIMGNILNAALTLPQSVFNLFADKLLGYLGF